MMKTTLGRRLAVAPDGEDGDESVVTDASGASVLRLAPGSLA
jgi:hypothetical protein